MKHRPRSARHEEPEAEPEPEHIPVLDDAVPEPPDPEPPEPEPVAAPVVAAAPEPAVTDWCPRCKEARLKPKPGAPYACARCHDRF